MEGVDAARLSRASAVLRRDAAVARSVKLLAAVIAGRSGAEQRSEQLEMTRLVATAAATGEPLIVQAGTGTGKSLAYLCGAVGAGARLVVSTATRQLSDQLLASDIPLVCAVAKSVVGRELTAAALKGRANYLCLAKVHELRELDAAAPPMDVALDLGIELPPEPEPAAVAGPVLGGALRPSAADVAALAEVLEWAADDPSTGDRSQAPAVPDRVWYQVSTDAAGCPGARNCLFGQECFAEAARAAAREADIVVINHALLAADLVSPGPLFDDRDLIVVDEVQELEGYLSSAWGHEIFAGTVERIALNASRRVPRDREAALTAAQAVLADSAAVVAALREVEGRRWDDGLPPVIDGPLESLRLHAGALNAALDKVAKDAGDPESTNAVQSARGQLAELVESIEAVRTKDREVVRWSDAGRDGNPGVIRSAPLQVGARFRELVGHRALVATSATACVAGDFEPTAAALGLTGPPILDSDGDPLVETWTGVDVGSPFDYRSQAILYVPRHLPEPMGKERADHTAAVLTELTELVQAAGGRTLALFTTTTAARNAAAHLRPKIRQTVLMHGELPAAALAQEFTEDETSVLCVTMGMWHGLNVVGPACTLVVIDKIPFMPMDDPLAAARRAQVDSEGRSGFREVFVNQAALMLTQGAGRLIRARDDRGVVAILDPRLHTKGYGSLMLRSLPPMWRTTDPEVVRDALARLDAHAVE